jgi:hypothetical protein
MVAFRHSPLTSLEKLLESENKRCEREQKRSFSVAGNVGKWFGVGMVALNYVTFLIKMLDGPRMVQ